MKISTGLKLFTLISLLGLGIAGSYFDLDRWFFVQLGRWQPDVQFTEGPDLDDPEQIVVYNITAGPDDLQNYEKETALHFDPRMVSGLESAIREYYRIFRLQPNTLAYVSVAGEPISNFQHKLKITVELGIESKEYSLLYSTQPTHWAANMDAFMEVIHQFKTDFKAHLRAMPIDNVTRAAFFSPEKPRYLAWDWFSVIHQSELALQEDAPNVEGFLRASEAYAWLSYYKLWNKDESLSNTLAAQALANYLLARVFLPAEDHSLAYGLGLIQWAMQRENEAVAQFEKLSAYRAAPLLTALLKRDLPTMQASLQKNNPYRIITTYLLARAYGATNQNRAAELILRPLLAENPDFSAAQRYYIGVAGLGAARSGLPQMMWDTLFSHQQIARIFADSMPTTTDDTEKTVDIIDYDIQSRLRSVGLAHKKILATVSGNRPSDRIMQGDVLRALLEMDFMNDLLQSYRTYVGVLGLFSQAEKIADVAAELYPHSDLAKVLRLWALETMGKPYKRQAYAKSLILDNSGALLLHQVLRTYGLSEDYRIWPRVASVQSLYNKKESKGSRGSKRQSFYSYYGLHRKKGIAYLKRSLALNKYDYAVYKNLVRYEKEEQYMHQGIAAVGHLYPFTIIAGDWFRDKKEYHTAAQWYKKAMAMSPDVATPYWRLAWLYRLQERYKEALAVYRQYLERDSSSLTAISMQVHISRVYQRLGQDKKAYNILYKIKNSYKADALLGFASASEQAGDIATAREYFKRNAKRYPVGYNAVALALFEERQGDTAAAIAALAKYQPNNTASYYFKEFLNYFAAKKEPEKLIEIVYGVHHASPDERTLTTLASTYADHQWFDLSAKIYRKIADTSEYKTYNLAKYYRQFRKNNKDEYRDALEDVFQLVATPYQQLGFADLMLQYGLYEEAFYLYVSLSDADFGDSNSFAVATVMMAYAWRAGELNDEVLAHLDKSVLDNWPWFATLVSYLLGDINENVMLQEVEENIQYTQAHHYIATIALLQGDTAAAIAHLQLTLAKGNINAEVYPFAYTLLSTLEEKRSDWCCNSDLR